MTNEDLTLYVVPTTLVPYGYEVIPLLGLPTGVKSRFRFREEWVSEQVISDYAALKEIRLVVVLRDFANGQLIPLRRGTVEDIGKIGETFFISFRLGPLIEYDSDKTLRGNQLDSYNAKFHQHHGEKFASLPSNPMKPLVFTTDFLFQFRNKNISTSDYYEVDLERFENIVSCIKDIEFFKGVQFLKVVDLTEVKKQKHAFVTDYNYLLSEDMEYNLRLYQTAPTISITDIQTPNDISISSDAKHINIIRGKRRAVGRYDVITFVFRTAYNSSSARTFIEVFYKLKQSGEQFIEPSFILPVTIEFTFNKLLKNIIIISLFIGVYLYAQTLRAVSSIVIDSLKDVAVVGFAAAIIDLKNKLLELSKRS